MGRATRSAAPEAAPTTAKSSAKSRSKTASKAKTVASPRIRKVKVAGDERDAPCLGCMHAAIQNKGQGFCFDAVGSTRCVSCANNNHACPAAPAGLVAPFLEYRDALFNQAPEAELTRLRKAFEVAKKGGAVAPGGTKKGRKAVKGKKKAVEEDEDDGEFAARARRALEGMWSAPGSEEEDFIEIENPFVEKSVSGAPRGVSGGVVGAAAAGAATGAAAGEAAGAVGGAVGGSARFSSAEEAAEAGARVDELCEVISGALSALVKEIMGIPY